MSILTFTCDMLFDMLFAHNNSYPFVAINQRKKTM